MQHGAVTINGFHCCTGRLNYQFEAFALEQIISKYIRASRIVKVSRNFAPRGSFATFFKVIFRSGLIFPIGSGLGVSIFQSKFLVKKH